MPRESSTKVTTSDTQSSWTMPSPADLTTTAADLSDKLAKWTPKVAEIVRQVEEAIRSSQEVPIARILRLPVHFDQLTDTVSDLHTAIQAGLRAVDTSTVIIEQLSHLDLQLLNTADASSIRLIDMSTVKGEGERKILQEYCTGKRTAGDETWPHVVAPKLRTHLLNLQRSGGVFLPASEQSQAALSQLDGRRGPFEESLKSLRSSLKTAIETFHSYEEAHKEDRVATMASTGSKEVAPISQEPQECQQVLYEKLMARRELEQGLQSEWKYFIQRSKESAEGGTRV